MRIVLNNSRELDVLIRAVEEMSKHGEVVFDLGPDSLEIAYTDTLEKDINDQEGSQENPELKSLISRRERNEAYASGRIDSLMSAFDIGLLALTDVAVLLDIPEDAAEKLYQIWHSDPVES